MTLTKRPQIAIIAVPWLLGMLFMVAAATHDLQVAKRQQLAEAIVIAHPDNHGSYEVRLLIGEKSYVGAVYPGDTRLELNERVHVYFDPIEPTTMSLISFSD